MFEILVGDVFTVDGNLLAVFKLRVGVVGDRVDMFVHFTYRDEVKLRPAAEFCGWLGAGLDNGTVKNLNREADFA
ncbi:hypothetical protein BH24DEI2_BH24DEI2_15920 [soil metagenome]